MDDEPLDEHEADERLAETDTIAQEGAAVLAGNLQEGLVALFLILIELGNIRESRLLPLARGQLVTLEELLERLGVDIEGRVLASVPLDDSRISGVTSSASSQWRSYHSCRTLDLAADLDVQFDVLVSPGT